MAGLSLYAHKYVGDQILTLGRWMSLHLLDPTDAGLTASEISTSGTGYARIDMLGKMSAFDLVTGRSTLISDVNVGPALTDWGLLTYAGFWDAVTAGNMIMSGALQTAQDTPAGKQFQLLAGQFSIGKLPIS